MVSYLLANGLTVSDDNTPPHLIRVWLKLLKVQAVVETAQWLPIQACKNDMLWTEKAGNHFKIRICDVNTNPLS